MEDSNIIACFVWKRAAECAQNIPYMCVFVCEREKLVTQSPLKPVPVSGRGPAEIKSIFSGNLSIKRKKTNIYSPNT